MGVTIVVCLEVLVTLKSDDVTEVSSKATKTLSALKTKINSSDDRIILESLEERVYALATRMPTIMKSQGFYFILF